MDFQLVANRKTHFAFTALMSELNQGRTIKFVQAAGLVAVA